MGQPKVELDGVDPVVIKATVPLRPKVDLGNYQDIRVKQVAVKVTKKQVNDVLKQIFLDGGLLLVDSKLEFGLFNGEVVLGDEFSPDGCRLWDKDTREKLDKDRFRQGLGGVVEAYEEVGRRIGITFP